MARHLPVGRPARPVRGRVSGRVRTIPLPDASRVPANRKAPPRAYRFRPSPLRSRCPTGTIWPSCKETMLCTTMTASSDAQKWNGAMAWPAPRSTVSCATTVSHCLSVSVPGRSDGRSQSWTHGWPHNHALPAKTRWDHSGPRGQHLLISRPTVAATVIDDRSATQESVPNVNVIAQSDYPYNQTWPSDPRSAREVFPIDETHRAPAFGLVKCIVPRFTRAPAPSRPFWPCACAGSTNGARPRSIRPLSSPSTGTIAQSAPDLRKRETRSIPSGSPLM